MRRRRDALMQRASEDVSRQKYTKIALRRMLSRKMAMGSLLCAFKRRKDLHADGDDTDDGCDVFDALRITQEVVIKKT